VPWRLTSDVEEYAERTWDLLTASPAEHTISLTVLETVRRGRRWSDEPMLFGWFEDGAEVRGAVFRTPPFHLLLGVVPEDAAAELVATLRAAGVSVPGVNGRDTDVERFTQAWTAATGARGETRVRLQLYELGTLRPPDPPPAGRARAADAGDLEVAIRWYTAFQAETPSPATDVATLVRERMDDRRLWLWEDELGAPVSLAARTPAVSGVARVAPVYTPPEQRRRGYGTAITAACTADALERGTERVVLFTDLSNPTSNAIYQRIGYLPIGARREVHFEPR
jgi:predicted GNAT family acetyltransferase